MPRRRKPLWEHVRDGTYREDRHGPLPANLRNGYDSSHDYEGADEKKDDQPAKVLSLPVRVFVPTESEQESPNVDLASYLSLGGVTKPPDLDDDASAIWDWLIERLGEVVSTRDAMRLEDLARSWGELVRVRRCLKDVQPGTIAYNRVLLAVKAYEDAVDRGSQKFGLTPADRAKLKIDAQYQSQPAKTPTRPKTKLDREGPS